MLNKEIGGVKVESGKGFYLLLDSTELKTFSTLNLVHIIHKLQDTYKYSRLKWSSH